MAELRRISSAAKKPGEEKILVVEDDPGVATLQRRHLERAGYGVDCVSSAEDALEKVEQGGIDLIVLDYGLPGMTGLEFYERLKANGHDLPVVMVTGQSNESVVIEALRLGVHNFVTKSPEYLDYLPEAAEIALAQMRIAQRLEESEERFRTLIENLQVGVVLSGSRSEIVLYNQAALELLGLTEEQLLGKTSFDPDWDVIRENGSPFPGEEHPVPQCIATRSSVRDVVMGVYRPSLDDRVWLLVNTEPQLAADGSVRHVVCTFTDITERKQAEETLRLRDRAIAASSNGILITDPNLPDHPIVYANPEFERMTGYTTEEALGRNLDFLHGSDTKQAAVEEIHAAIREKRYCTVVMRNYRKNGAMFWNELSISPVNDDNGCLTHFVGVLQDITERKALEERIAYQAFHDPLTDLPNRTLFTDRLRQAVSRARRSEHSVAVLFMDLDNFKVVNDSLGHEEGDQLLTAVATRIRTHLRPGDTPARLGGDEFTVLLEDVAGIREAIRVAERLVTALRAPFILKEQEVLVTTSIGIALSTSGEDPPENLLRDADTAMYEAKRKGKANYEVFHSSMYAQALERLQLEADLRRAIERDELRIYYQPKVELGTGKVTDVEALVRWEHSARGLLPPAHFIPIAEETGLIVQLGQRVLETACRQVRVWQERYPSAPPLSVSVNLSPRQFQQPDLVDTVGATLRETELEPRCLQLEITENTVMGDEESAVETLRGLKSLGVQLAVDDFGTGYSSLSSLMRFPVDELKIDKSFVSKLGKDPEGTEELAIVRMIVDLGHMFGARVTAEGVENARQLELLREKKCDLAQGYYFAKPQPGEATATLLPRSFG